MQVGDLVKITRTSIGVPTGTIGLIVDRLLPPYEESPEIDAPTDTHLDMELFQVELYGAKAKARRYLPRDLEVINESR